jgi:Fur family zinc uptake transcriptional regulator
MSQVEASGYRLAGDDIELKGICPACQAAEDPSAHQHDHASH